MKTYLTALDPDNSLELSNQSMVCYQCGNIRRVFKNPEPDRRPSLLPDTRIWVSFRGRIERGSLEDLLFVNHILLHTISQTRYLRQDIGYNLYFPLKRED